MNIKNTLIYLIGLVIYTGLILYFYRPDAEVVYQRMKPEYWEKPGFKPDTTYLPGKPYPVPQPYEVQIPGKSYTIYDTVPKIVYRDTSGRDVFISQNYGKYPFLISGDFSKDTVVLTTEETDGRIMTKHYPVNYERFKYRYLNSGMSVSELPPTKANKDPFFKYSGTWINYQRDVISKNDRLSLDADMTIKNKVKVGVFGEKYLGNSLVPDQVGFKVGVSLF